MQPPVDSVSETAPARSPSAALRAFPARARALIARGWELFCNWPRGAWPIPTGTSLFVLALLLVAVVELLPKGFSDITLTVRARTEVVELTLEPQRTYVWWVPAGSYSLLTPATAPGCEVRGPLDVACAFGAASAITIKGGAVARFEILPATEALIPRFTMTLTPAGDAATAVRSVFEIRNAGSDAPVVTNELVTFEAPAAASWRVPVIVERVQIGDFLAESIAGDDALGFAHQPILTEGDVRMFARSLGFEERYQVQEERFDPADVVQIPADAGEAGLLLGLVSLPIDDGRGFDVTFHTDVAEVFVRRLGAEHRIGVSTWSVISRLPLWLALWVVWAAFVTLANYHSARLGRVRG